MFNANMILLYILVNFWRFRRPYLCRSLAWEFGVTLGCLFEFIVSPSNTQSSGNGRSFPMLRIIANNCASFKCPKNHIQYIWFYRIFLLSPVYESNGVTGDILFLLCIAWSVNFLRRTVDGSNGWMYCLTNVTHTVPLHTRLKNNRRFKFNIRVLELVFMFPL